MATDQDRDPPAGKDRPWTLRDYLWRGALISLTIFVILATIITFGLYMQYARYARDLADTIDAIKASGGPLDEAEIEAYYSVPDDMEDLTQEYLLALGPFIQRNNVPQKQSPEEEQLPYVGQKATEHSQLVGAGFDLRPVAENYLAPLEPSFEKLRALAHKTGGCRYPVKMADNISALIPHAQVIRDAARHLQLDFDLQMLAGNRELALEDLLAILKTGETLKLEPITISQLVRSAVFAVFVKHAQRFLAEGKATEAELAALDAALAELDFQDGLKRALNGERAMGYLALKTHDARQIGTLTSGGNSASSYLPPLGNLKDLRPGDTAALLQMETDMLEAAESDFPLALEKMKQIDDKLRRMVGEQALPWNKNVLTALLAPAMTKAAETTARCLALQRSLRAAVAMERHFRATGERAPALADLVPEYLDAVPIDPFSGRLLQLKVTDDGYLIYATGKDGVDNGGLIEDMQTDIGVKIKTSAAEAAAASSP